MIKQVFRITKMVFTIGLVAACSKSAVVGTDLEAQAFNELKSGSLQSRGIKANRKGTIDIVWGGDYPGCVNWKMYFAASDPNYTQQSLELVKSLKGESISEDSFTTTPSGLIYINTKTHGGFDGIRVATEYSNRLYVVGFSATPCSIPSESLGFLTHPYFDPVAKHDILNLYKGKLRMVFDTN